MDSMTMLADVLPSLNVSGLIKWLSILGGALLGGLIVWVLAKVTIRVKTPTWPRNLLTLIGAVAGGALVAMWVYGGGGSGVGGSGGLGIGSGTGKGDSNGQAQKQGNEEKPKVTDKGLIIPLGGKRLTLEVLEFDEDREHPLRLFRLPDLPGKPEYTFDELKSKIDDLQTEHPKLAEIVLITHDKSPGTGSRLMKDLNQWLDRHATLKVAKRIKSSS